MSNRVFLWVDRVSERGIYSKIFYHTSICVQFGKTLKYVFSYNEDGLTYSPAKQDDLPKKVKFLGYTTYTLPEVVEHCEELLKNQFKEYNMIHGNCNYFSNALSKGICGKKVPKKYRMQGQLAISVTAVTVGTILSVVAVGLGILFRR